MELSTPATIPYLFNSSQTRVDIAFSKIAQYEILLIADNFHLLLKNAKEDPVYSCIASVRHPAMPRPRKIRKHYYIF